ncbi:MULTISPECIES: hypothetical protein [unclassified Rhizobium]|uniref:hypothetical protein n=1 Tax=unclassified Rhizobium TaxID=2613769 RepID=UPI0007EA85E0|nr:MULTISPECIES: hypothetical protein [unclassified Rhizobium]ANM11025.1 hypothetical protein AMK05_CH02651 [Rhizobium sp. N324]ANM17566.1 hypothetical protein AMK06_CH02678 [Rhizobium sp. N541]ANM23951.1 hypothetical protein AMK07_CH02675 [Rhizobium sp. N941]OYD04626.1 hypothetical protein AMK08_CH102670 [Rhizobium sp. N4311]
MRVISKIVALCAAIAFAIAATGTAAADALVFNYHGWQVDLTNARGAEPDREMVTAVKRQLDIVEHVDLKPDILKFMRTIRIWANPAAAGFGPGHYSSKTGIDLRVRGLEPDKPIILHELLHAYNDRMLPGGFGNSDIKQFFNSGQALWLGNSYMMSNDREFFAVTASVYLFGDIDRPPYSRSQLKTNQPRYYQWLATLFDDGRPRS